MDKYTSFAYDIPHEESDATCNKIPPSSPQRGDEEYYVWRFNNFMERHLEDCAHEPPVYYYGPLVDPATVIKTDAEKTSDNSWIGKVKKAWDETTLNPKEIYLRLGLDDALEEKQQSAQQYVKNGETVIPNISRSYGYKYCLAFGKLLKPKLTTQGQAWVTKALNFLQEYMEAGLVGKNWIAEQNVKFNDRHSLMGKDGPKNFYTDIELSNARFKEFAFATHPDAYLEAGLADLPFSDLVKILLTPDLAEWWDGATREQAGLVADDVIEHKVEDAKRKSREIMERIRDFFD